MGTIYKRAYGVSQNYILAYMWFDVATHDARFEGLSKDDIAQLTPHMASSQISEAESLAQQCLQSNYQACPPTRDNMASSANRNPSQTRLPLKASGGTFVVPVDINGVVTLNVFIDSGASDVTVPADVFSTLKRTGTIRESDVVGQRTYLLADGSKTQATTFTIRSLRVGEMLIEKVDASVAPSQGSLLLGQSFLNRFKLWSIDNATQELLLEAR
jgi:clan AA aspartic protease (TIGR02281 family)